MIVKFNLKVAIAFLLLAASAVAIVEPKSTLDLVIGVVGAITGIAIGVFERINN